MSCGADPESNFREAGGKALPFTEEGLTTACASHAAVERDHRYLLARDYCRGRDVLDVAPGDGSGTALLSQVARSAIGLGIEAAAIRGFGRPGLRCLVGDARAMPLPDACMDVVVCFEMPEHLDGPQRVLDECRRVLRPGGLLVIGTPDRVAYSRPGTPPIHRFSRELDWPEFEAMLRARFSQIALAAQHPMIGSAIIGEGSLPPPGFRCTAG